MADYLLKADEYGNEKTITEGEEFIFTTTTLLFNKTGFIPEIPYLGINLKERRNIAVNDTIAIDDLRADILKQVRYFYPSDNIVIIVEMRKDSDNKDFLYVDVLNTSKGISATVNYITENPTVAVSYKDYNK